MAGSREQGLKAAETNRKRYGKEFYGRIGRKGGKASKGGGFALHPELAAEAGRKGGSAPRRKRNTEGDFYEVTGNKHANFILQSIQRVAKTYRD
jgi:general stress protein YciG